MFRSLMMRSKIFRQSNSIHSHSNNIQRCCFSSYAQVHKLALEQGELTYKDPETGYDVFSELSHLKRGKCCGKTCRHCPFGHLRVNPWERQPIVADSGISKRPTLLKSATTRNIPLSNQPNTNTNLIAMLWSGSVGSYTSLSSVGTTVGLNQPNNTKTVLVSFFDINTGFLIKLCQDVDIFSKKNNEEEMSFAHHTHLHQIMDQAISLKKFNLLTIPISSFNKQSTCIASAYHEALNILKKDEEFNITTYSGIIEQEFENQISDKITPSSSSSSSSSTSSSTTSSSSSSSSSTTLSQLLGTEVLSPVKHCEESELILNMASLIESNRHSICRTKGKENILPFPRRLFITPQNNRQNIDYKRNECDNDNKEEDVLSEILIENESILVNSDLLSMIQSEMVKDPNVQTRLKRSFLEF